VTKITVAIMTVIRVVAGVIVNASLFFSPERCRMAFAVSTAELRSDCEATGAVENR